MVRWSKKEKQDKRVLLSSLNQMDTSASSHEADNGKYKQKQYWICSPFVPFLFHSINTEYVPFIRIVCQLMCFISDIVTHKCQQTPQNNNIISRHNATLNIVFSSQRIIRCVFKRTVSIEIIWPYCQ